MKPKHLISIVILMVAAFGIWSANNRTRADGFPSGSPTYYTNAESAKEAAGKSGKPLVMIFSASWCGICLDNRSSVYPSKAVRSYHDQFVWAYLDVDDEANQELKQKLKVRGMPHIEVVDNSGKRLAKSVGGTSPEELCKTLTIALKAAKSAS